MGVVARLVVALSVAVGPAIPVVVGLGASVVVGLGTSVAVPAAVSVGVGVASSAMTCEVPNGFRTRASATTRATETAGYATTARRRI
jgi:hypothetical protein